MFRELFHPFFRYDHVTLVDHPRDCSACLFGRLHQPPPSALAETKSTETKSTETKSTEAKSDDAKSSEPKTKVARIDKGELPTFTKAHEAAAVTFAQNHHPELAELLGGLKQHNRGEYEKAIRELFRTSERLAQWQEKGPQRYEHELAMWKLNSRIRILTARLTMSTDVAVERELREALVELAALKKQQLEAERQKLFSRLAEIDAELKRDVNTTIDERLQQVLQGTEKRRSMRTKNTNEKSEKKVK